MSGQISGHFWIADETGKVIYDPDFPAYEAIRKFRRCTEEAVYIPADPEEQKEMIQQWILPHLTNPQARKMAKTMKKSGNLISVPYACQANAAFWKLTGGRGKVVYGSMGWKKKKGGNWIEFEHTRMPMAKKEKIITAIVASTALAASAAALCL